MENPGGFDQITNDLRDGSPPVGECPPQNAYATAGRLAEQAGLFLQGKRMRVA
jgi:hypothetical protein